MKMTFRWYGNDDPISLKYIKQIPNCSGLMIMLNDFKAGEVWDKDIFQKYVDQAHAAGLEVEVIESINVHEDIKMGLPTRDKYIQNYKQSLRNVAAAGVKVVVYNFMPVFDWLKTDLGHVLADGSNTLSYDEKDIQGLTPQELVNKTLQGAGNLTLPGWEPERLAELNKVLEIYKNIDEDKLRANYKYFLEEIIPTCEEVGIRMAVHPDDPAWPVFGIPRISHTPEQLRQILALVDSPANSLCLCTGSIGSEPNNNVAEIIAEFAKKDRIACAHVRNIKFEGDRKFYESSHFTGDGSLDMYAIMKALYDNGFDGYIRPDHGRMIWGEEGRAGYGLYDRALGLAYLNGLWEALEHQDK
ncbi:mannonate dehydratase [Criibacterium bergeronii]|uniref:Mannonate dehydratase n=1 Tax=Criibacterium bergeronii TaxID=1871336 RepID=A0A552V393_9FIRM|nr:mannonate dehydratase [Criibacterium bergeronii]TRW24917.1 mannonate dehydratase [Criibacterium bergeronii]